PLRLWSGEIADSVGQSAGRESPPRMQVAGQSNERPVTVKRLYWASTSCTDCQVGQRVYPAECATRCRGGASALYQCNHSNGRSLKASRSSNNRDSCPARHARAADILWTFLHKRVATTSTPPPMPTRTRRFHLAEPLVMLATVVQWLVLSILTGALVGVGCTIFLRALFATAGRAYAAPLWLQMTLLPLGGL